MIKLIFALSILSLISASPIRLEDQRSYHSNGTYTELLEGDIIAQPKIGRSFGLGSRSQNWDYGVIPYEIVGYSSSEEAIILRGMEILSTKTDSCLSFRPKTSSDRNWIRIVSDTGCNSYVGKTGYGGQKVSLARNGCLLKGTVVHELMHAAGFHHEQNRPDRDQYIRVVYENIDPAFHFAFDKQQGGEYFGTTYDLNSIMQYYEKSFSKNGQKTIIPLNGQYLTPVFSKTEDQILTNSDIQAVKNLYQCSGSSNNNNNNNDNNNNNSGNTLAPNQVYNMKIYNDLGVTVQYKWIDYSGNEVYYGTIYSGKTASQSTYTSHKWVVKGTGVNKTFTVGKGKIIDQNQYIYLSSL